MTHDTWYIGLAEGLSFYQMILLGTFESSVGDLTHVVYRPYLKREKNTTAKMVNVQLLNFVWMIQCFFLLVIMLNFIIAVITSTYVRVIDYQKIITFK